MTTPAWAAGSAPPAGLAYVAVTSRRAGGGSCGAAARTRCRKPGRGGVRAPGPPLVLRSRRDSAGAVVGDRPEEVGVSSRRRRERGRAVRVSPEFVGGLPEPWAAGPDRAASRGTGGGHSGQVSRVRRSRGPTGHRGRAVDGRTPSSTIPGSRPRRRSRGVTRARRARRRHTFPPFAGAGRTRRPVRHPRPGVATGRDPPRPGRTHAAPVRLSVPSPGPRSAWRARARPG